MRIWQVPEVVCTRCLRRGTDQAQVCQLIHDALGIGLYKTGFSLYLHHLLSQFTPDNYLPPNMY